MKLLHYIDLRFINVIIKIW